MRNKLIVVLVCQGLLGFLLGACSSNTSKDVKAEVLSTPVPKQQENIVNPTAQQNTSKNAISSDNSAKNEAVQEELKNTLDSTKTKLALDEINTQQAESQFKKVRNDVRADVETATSARNLLMDLKQAELDKQNNILETSLNEIERSFVNEEISESLKASKTYQVKKQILAKEININQEVVKEIGIFKKILKSKIKNIDNRINELSKNNDVQKK